MIKKLIISFFVLTILINNVRSQLYTSFETGLVYPKYNDVCIPNKTGSFFSLRDDLKSNLKVYYRINIHYQINKHSFNLLFAPLSVKSYGSIDKDISFNNYLFPANQEIEAIYKFNSYRISYHYNIIELQKIILGFGLTIKMRDAEIKLSNQNYSTSSTNLGFVPLFHLLVQYNLNKKINVRLEGDALGAKQGRAEDFLLSLNYLYNTQFEFFTGYRILEGGSDGGSVYTFAWFNYFAIGCRLKAKKPD